jgi:hypothetical protein
MKLRHLCIAAILVLSISVLSAGQSASEDVQFGPVVRSYLGYLRNEQNVVDDRVSRHEVSRQYYRRNSNRIRALRLMAIKIADESGNDYLPELEAVATDEFGLLFENPPRFQSLKVGSVVGTRFRYLGSVRSTEVFYLFARLDPYEQAELIQAGAGSAEADDVSSQNHSPRAGEVTRARRVNPK